MIISQIQEKVKRTVKKVVAEIGDEISKPQGKFVLEFVSGVLLTGGLNVTEIAKALKEKTQVKHTLKRLLRMSDQESLLAIANKMSLRDAAGKITDNTVLALDGGDIAHQYGKAFEKSSYVKDGSSGKICKGYNLNQISGYNEKSHETIPILLEIYSTVEKGFKSANEKTLKLIDRLVKEIGTKGLWVLDRGYDSEIIFKHLIKLGLAFVIRMTKLRNIIFRGKAVNIKEAAQKINRRHKYGNHGRYGSEKVLLKLSKGEHRMTLISYKDKRNKEIMFLLTVGWIKSSKEIKRRIRGYFRRWGVEECYRFEKQGFGIEKLTVRKYSRIKTLLGVSLLSWIVLIKIGDNGKLRESVIKKARMEKAKLKDRPRFIYYRLLKGIKETFAGIRELFRIRVSRKEQQKKLKKIANQLPPLLKTMFAPHDLLSDLILGVA